MSLKCIIGGREWVLYWDIWHQDNQFVFPGGLRATQSFTFADVDRPILGVDFFRDHNLTIDLTRRELFRRQGTGADCYGEVFPCSVASVSNSLASLRPMNELCNAVLDEFPEILQPRFGSFKNSHGVEHHVPTTGPPLFSRAQRLGPDKLASAKAAFHLSLIHI